MADTSLSAFVRHLRHLASPAADARDDRQLLAAFSTRQEQAAFAMLVRRHGPMVLKVCRRVLHHEQDAEDAFQATFLVLAAKAASLSIRTSIAGFLHGVAYRLALKARREATRRRRREAGAATPAASDAAEELSWREVQAVVEEEMQRLPEKYRLPFVLCHLEGLSRAEAGRQLGLKEGTVWSRLAQARARLQRRLERRGIALTAVLGALAVSETPVRAGLIESVVCVARPSAAGAAAGAVSARVALLTQAGLQTMTGKMKLALTGLVMLLAVGVGGVGYQALTAQAPETPAATTPPAKAAPEAKEPETPQVRRDRHGDPLPEGVIARLGTVRWRHGFFVRGLVYSPDGKKIAAVGAGRAITLWDAASGKEIHQFPNRNQPNAVALSPDGKMLATTDTPNCHLWDVATGKELRQLKGHTNGLTGVAFAPDGKTLATVSYDGTARIWDALTGKQLRQLDCQQDNLYSVAYSPDGKLMATAGKDGTIRVWDAVTAKEKHRLIGHGKGIFNILFSTDGKQVVSASEDGTLRLWDAVTGGKGRILGEKLGEYLRAIALSPDGKLLASGQGYGTIRLWDMRTGEEQRHWEAGKSGVQTVAFSPDAKTLATGTAWDGGIRQWDVATGKELHPSDEHRGFIDFLRFSPDGKTLISLGRDKRLLHWDLAANAPRQLFSWTTKRYSGTALSPDGNTLAVNGWPDSLLRLLDVRTGKPGHALGKPQENVFWHIAFSPNGRLVASEGDKGAIHLWDVTDGSEVHQLKGNGTDEEVMGLTFSPDNKVLASGTGKQGANPRALRLWDVNSGKEIRSFNGVGPNYALAFSPTGDVLAAGLGGDTHTGFVQLWETATGKALCRHSGHRDWVGPIAFSPDGKLVVSGTGSTGQKDNSVHVWEAATGRLIRRFEGHHSCVGCVVFSPDGLTVASGAGDSTILLWDITGRRIDGHWHPKPLTLRELDACWIALANEDAAKAYDAVWMLAASPEQALPLLRKHLSPVPRPDAKLVARLIADLDSEEFRKREKATEEIGKLGDAAAPTLRQALQAKPTLEMRRRLQQLLDQSRDWTPERLREHRAIQALEHIGTRQAKEVLEALAAGAPGVQRTEEAKAARRRLARQ